MKRNMIILFGSISTLIILTSVILFIIIFYLGDGLNIKDRIVVQGNIAPDNAAIFIYDGFMKRLNRITPTNILAFSPAWSHDGKFIAFVERGIDENGYNIAIIDTKTKKITTNIINEFGDSTIHSDTSLAWSSDDRSLLFNLYNNEHCHSLYIFDIYNKISRSIIKNICHGDYEKDIYQINISWVKDQDPIIGITYQSYYSDDDDIYILNQNTTGLNFVAKGGYPLWNPKTKDISFICKNPQTGFPSICEYSLIKKNKNIIVTDYSKNKYTDNRYSWSNDGMTMYYIESTGESDPVYLSLLNINTGEKKHLTILEELHFPFSNKWMGENVICYSG